jgi:LmbE family N-acetylglucosaminyl deacetylase
MSTARVLAVSPHLDDAALSAGACLAALAAEGADVTVLTVFAGTPREALSPIARGLHRRCGLPETARAIRTRRAEDRRAATVLGARAIHAPLLDAVYRRGADGGWLCTHDRAVVAPGLPPEPDVAERVRDAVAAACRALRPHVVMTSAGAGGHVDHRLVRDATRAAAGAHDLLFWEDLPYAITRPAGVESVAPLVARAPDAAWQRKWAAVGCYTSQLALFWASPAEGRATLERHACVCGGGVPAERLWRLPAAQEATWTSR